MAKKIEIDLSLTRETKNTGRYDEAQAADGSEPVLGTVYVPKATLRQLAGTGPADALPSQVTVVLSV